MVSESSMKKLSKTNSRGPIYLDYQSTTPTDPMVIESMLPFFSKRFGNPHSNSHSFGWAAQDAIEVARRKIASLIGADSKEIIFTSGATESNNLAIQGLVGNSKKGKHIVTTKVEHKCVLEACRKLERNDARVTYLEVTESGELEIDTFIKALEEDTFLVSVMGVNNETGVIQPLEEIGAICREKGIYFHSDCAQAIGKIPIDVEQMKIDLMSISGHKFYAPMGIGALYVRRRPRVFLKAIFEGGGQEFGLRSGTLPLPLCVGLGEAAYLSAKEMTSEAVRLKSFQETFLSYLRKEIPKIRVNGSLKNRIPGNLNLCLPDINAEVFLAQLRGLAISTGSACSSASIEPSYVLKAMGMSDIDIRASVRIGFGRFTSMEEVKRSASILCQGIHKQLANVNHRTSMKEVAHHA